MEKVKKVLLIIAAVAIGMVNTANAQVAINSDGSDPDASAMLDVKSADQGFLPPRVANVSSVSRPVAGLMVFDLSNNCMRYYNGSVWSECMGRTFTCGDALIDSRDGKPYATVQIGTQCWMAENLNIGIRIVGSGNQTDNNTIEKYCYDDNTSNCGTYGGLYQWDEMMGYVTTEGAQGICPTGWHLPTDAEWMTLEEEVESTSGVSWNTVGWRGTDAGGNLKETGTSHWASPNMGATNSSSFTGLPGGYRFTNGSFNYLTYYAYFWSSVEYGSYAWSRSLHNNFALVYRWGDLRAYAYSVRCVRD